jgi:hypothetical protein
MVSELKDLNAFEQCLLIHLLVSKGKKERAQEIANGIRDRNSPPSIDQMNRIYDIVLNMNSLNSKPSDGKAYIIQTYRYSLLTRKRKETSNAKNGERL